MGLPLNPFADGQRAVHLKEVHSGGRSGEETIIKSLTDCTSGPFRGRFPSDSISHVVWLYRRFCLSFRDVENWGAAVGSQSVSRPPGNFTPTQG